MRGAIPSCTGSPSGTLCGSLHRPTAITNRGGETCSWWSGERCHPGARRADGGPGAGAVARQRGHAVVGSRVRGAIPSCTGSPSGTLCGSLHRPTAITNRGGETCSWWSGGTVSPGGSERGAGGGVSPGGGLGERCDTLMHWKPQRHGVVACTAPQPSPSVAARHALGGRGNGVTRGLGGLTGGRGRVRWLGSADTRWWARV